MSSPKVKVDKEALDGISNGMVELTQKLVNHAKSHPILNSKDASEVKGIAKLALEVSAQMTSDPFFMARIVENMSKEKVSALNEWIRLNKTMGR